MFLFITKGFFCSKFFYTVHYSLSVVLLVL